MGLSHGRRPSTPMRYARGNTPEGRCALQRDALRTMEAQGIRGTSVGCHVWAGEALETSVIDTLSSRREGGRAMKVRFGFTCRGQADLTLDAFPPLVDDLERLGFDSLWLPEHMLNGPFDPLVGLAHAAARTTRLKLGAYLIVPRRNPVRLARELANLDRLSGGRLLLIMVLGQPTAAERLAQHVTKVERGALLEEVLPLLRRLWSGAVVHHDGPRYQLRDARLSPTRVQTPLAVWLGGQVPEALRRA